MLSTLLSEFYLYNENNAKTLETFRQSFRGFFSKGKGKKVKWQHKLESISEKKKIDVMHCKMKNKMKE